MIDQHLIEFQKLYSASKVVDQKKSSRKGSSRKPSAEKKQSSLSNRPSLANHFSGETSQQTTTVKTNHLSESSVTRHHLSTSDVKSSENHHRRGASDINDLNPEKKKKHHRRRASDIDDLTPEVLQALQSTFGGKLDAIRSKLRAPSPSPLSSPSSSCHYSTPPRSPVPIPPVTTITPADVERKLTFVQRLGDKDGRDILIAYFTAIVLSVFILISAEDEKGRLSERGRADTNCARNYGTILPFGITSVFFTFAFVFFVLNMTFSLFTVLMAAKDFLREMVSRKKDGKQQSREKLSVCDFLIHFGFFLTAGALLWLARITTAEPLVTMCEKRLRLFWMLGLMVMDLVIFWSALPLFKGSQAEKEQSRNSARIVLFIFCLMLLFSPFYKVGHEEEDLVGDQERVLFQPFGEGKELSIRDLSQSKYEELEKCYIPPGITGLEISCLGRTSRRQQCIWSCNCDCRPRPQEIKQCGWDRTKRIEVYQRQDKCKEGYPQCEWPKLKQVQVYEAEDRCFITEGEKCEWPWLKQIQVFKHGDRCDAWDESLHQCAWPLLKRVEIFRAGEVCLVNEPLVCEWPNAKQIQPFQAAEQCFVEKGQQCDWPWLKQIQKFEAGDQCSAEKSQLCDWPWVMQIQPFRGGESCAVESVQCDWPWVKQIQEVEN